MAKPEHKRVIEECKWWNDNAWFSGNDNWPDIPYKYLSLLDFNKEGMICIYDTYRNIIGKSRWNNVK